MLTTVALWHHVRGNELGFGARSLEDGVQRGAVGWVEAELALADAHEVWDRADAGLVQLREVAGGHAGAVHELPESLLVGVSSARRLCAE